MQLLVKSELYKLLTVRSTYIISLLAFVLAGFISFWIIGYKGTPGQDAIAMQTVKDVCTTLPIFIAIIGILLVSHEYRFNTITYTLTASNSRSKVLLAKILTMGIFALALTVLVALACVALSWLGASMQASQIAPQHFYYWDTLWRSTFYTLAFVWVSLMFAVLFRHVVGALIVLLVGTTTVEAALSALLKENSKYLPFTALEQVQTVGMLSHLHAALIFSCYLVVGWAVAWILFLRRDAN